MNFLISLAFASATLANVPNLKTLWRDGWYRAAVGHNGFEGVIWYNPDNAKFEMNFNKRPNFDYFQLKTHAVAYADQHHVENGVSGFDVTKLGNTYEYLYMGFFVNPVATEDEDGTFTFEAILATYTIEIFDTIVILEKITNEVICGGTFIAGKLEQYNWVLPDYQVIIYMADQQHLAINLLNFNDPTFYKAEAYTQVDCAGEVVATKKGNTNSINEWFKFAYNSDILSIRFLDNAKCHNLDASKKHSANAVQLNAPGIKMSFKQNSIFEPTYYSLEYNQLKTQSDEALGGYHVHKWPLPDSEIGSSNRGNAGCGDTGGHWNPYGINKPEGGFESGREHEYYEIGDLSSKFGSLADKIRQKGSWIDFNLPLFGINNIEQRSIVFHAANGGARKLCYNLRNGLSNERNHAHFINSFTRDQGGLLLKLSVYQPGWSTPTALHVYTEADNTVSSSSFDVYLNEGICSGVAASGLPGALNTSNFKQVDSGIKNANRSEVVLQSTSLLTTTAFNYDGESTTSALYKILSGEWMKKDTMYSLVLVDDNGDNVGCFDLYEPVIPVSVNENGQFKQGKFCVAPKKKMKGNFGGVRAQACKNNDSKQSFYNDNGWKIRMNNNENSCIAASKNGNGRVHLAKCDNNSDMQMWAYKDGKTSLVNRSSRCIKIKGRKLLMGKC